jgi:hypothetical protein
LANLKSDQLAADLVQVPGNWVCSFPENLADVPADIITLANAQNTFFTAPLAGSTCNGVLKGLPIEYNLEYGGIVATLGRIACDLMAELRVDGRQNPLLISNPTGYNSSLAFTLTVRYGMPKVVLPPDVEPTSATVSLINSARADSYILASFPPSATSLVYALLANQTLGDPARWYLSPTLHSPIFLESLPQGAMVGASGVAQGTSPGADEFRAQFIARWQDQPLDDAYPFYDSGALSTLALQRAAAREGAIRSGAALSSRLIAVTRPGGTPIRWNELGRGLEELRQGREITYVGLSGPLEFDALGNTTGAIANWWNISARGFSDRLEQSNCP